MEFRVAASFFIAAIVYSYLPITFGVPVTPSCEYKDVILITPTVVSDYVQSLLDAVTKRYLLLKKGNNLGIIHSTKENESISYLQCKESSDFSNSIAKSADKAGGQDGLLKGCNQIKSSGNQKKIALIANTHGNENGARKLECEISSLLKACENVENIEGIYVILSNRTAEVSNDTKKFVEIDQLSTVHEIVNLLLPESCNSNGNGGNSGKNSNSGSDNDSDSDNDSGRKSRKRSGNSSDSGSGNDSDSDNDSGRKSKKRSGKKKKRRRQKSDDSDSDSDKDSD